MTDKQARRDDDRLWIQDGIRNGWRLPPKAAWPLRLPVIRNIRAMWLDWRACRHAEAMGTVGLGLGAMHPRDAWIIYAVSRGWC